MFVVAQPQRHHPSDPPARPQAFADPIDQSEEDVVERVGRDLTPPERSLRADRRSTPTGDHPTGVVIHGQGVQVATAGRAQHRHESGLGHGGHMADGVEPLGPQLVGGDRADAPQRPHIEGMEELELVIGVDHQQAVGLAHPRGHLGQELGAGDPDGDGQPDLLGHPLAQPRGDGSRSPREPAQAVHVEKRLVDGQAFDQRGGVAEDLEHGRAGLRVSRHPRADHDCVGAERLGLAAPHGGADTESAGLVAGGEHDPAADDDRATP